MRSSGPSSAPPSSLFARYRLTGLVLTGLVLAVGLGAVSGLGWQAAALAGLAASVLASVLGFRRWPLWLTLAILAWLPFQNIAIAELVLAGHLASSAAQLLTLLKEVCVLGLLVVLAFSGRTWRLGLADGLFIIFLVWIISYLPRGDLSLTARVAGVRMLSIPLLLYFLGRFLPGTNSPKYVLAVVLTTAVFVALWGWFELAVIDVEFLGALQAASAAAKGQSLPSLAPQLAGAFYTIIGSAFTGDVIWVRRMISTYLEPLSLGHALILPVTFLFYQLVAARPPLLGPRWLVAGLLVFIGLTQVMAISRGALLASLIAAGLITLTMRRARLPALTLLAVALIGALILPSSRTFILSTIRLEDPSSIAHASALRSGWGVALSNPLGFGLGHGGYVSTQFAAGNAEGTGESFYFAMISQVGVVGALLFVAGTLRLLWMLAQVAQSTRQPWLRTAAVVAATALAGYSFSAIFSEAAFGMLSTAGVWLLAGLVVQAGYAERRDRAADQMPAPVGL